ncbi:MAG TPA: deoxyribodipyrimidine photo-lyase [Candidatus Obscuribacter sp.]|nr:deoxyribodipyrimidine photo-lyase [Candidatus Obscuribacter sp.]
MKSNNTSIFWFRQDLRLEDNPALTAALASQRCYLVYIWAPEEESPWEPGGASRVFLHESLSDLERQIAAAGGRLHFFKAGRGQTFSSSLSALQAIAENCGARSIYWNRRYEPEVIRRDSEIKAALKASGLTVETFNGALLKEPWQVKTKEGKPFQVFTPFWRACLNELDLEPPLPVPADLHRAGNLGQALPDTVSVPDLALLPSISWHKSIVASYAAGEREAHQALEHFLKNALANYSIDRDKPHRQGVSRLSTYLHFGQISPRTVWHRTKAYSARSKNCQEAAAAFLRELGWREFSHHLLFHFPETTQTPLRKDFLHFPWQKDEALLKAWQKGLTGYPIVDAGMRELWQTGIMHNRVRMITASFLVKHLLQPWQEGAQWFWDTLIDADLAQNTLGWQWTAGCGADAAPYFRIFNPMLQGEKFDPDGLYIKRYVPELAALGSKYIHAPWTAPPEVLRKAGITLGTTYPGPIVDHSEARQRALAAFQTLKELKAVCTS